MLHQIMKMCQGAMSVTDEALLTFFQTNLSGEWRADAEGCFETLKASHFSYVYSQDILHARCPPTCTQTGYPACLLPPAHCPCMPILPRTGYPACPLSPFLPSVHAHCPPSPSLHAHCPPCPHPCMPTVPRTSYPACPLPPCMQTVPLSLLIPACPLSPRTSYPACPLSPCKPTVPTKCTQKRYPLCSLSPKCAKTGYPACPLPPLCTDKPFFMPTVP
ncbi:hypothetical protein BaRGS_00014236 [Batillaria attramentaria]|uniref:Uncharacterized protein n=1 Tax=Batillaria attramentaria TaxID=370345 RepID=A0ABD0L5R9_9CAEN